MTRVYDPATQCCTKNGIERKYPIRNFESCRETRVPRAGVQAEGRRRDAGQRAAPRFPTATGRPASYVPAELHDKCYDTCRSKRSECDEKFTKRMKHACTNTYPVPGTPNRVLHGEGGAVQQGGHRAR